MRAWSEDRFRHSINILESILREHPRDLLALQVAHLANFYIGDAPNLRDGAVRVLASYDSDAPGYGSVLDMLAFGLEDCGEYAKAEQSGLRALELNKVDAWAIHAVAHVLEMQGKRHEGIKWNESRKSDWPATVDFATHNSWYLALLQKTR